MNFDRDQLKELTAGKDAGVDITLYSNPLLPAVCMREIRMGLKEGLDVSCYADPKYDWFQMEEIRTGLENGINVSGYLDPSIDYSVMRELRYSLEEGIDLTKYKKYKAGILRQLRLSILSKTDISGYITGGYDDDQIDEIRLAKEMYLPIDGLVTNEFRSVSIHEIVIGLSKGLDVSEYASIKYGWQQMREIRLGLEHRVDISQYKNPLYSWQQMYELRMGLEYGGDISEYRSFMYTAADMRKLRIKHGHVSDDESISYRKASDEELTAAPRRPAIHGRDGYYELLIPGRESTVPVIGEDGVFHHDDMSFITIVEKGMAVAEYHPATKGIPGVRVDGTVIQAKPGKNQELLTGYGFKLRDDGVTYEAVTDGRMVLSDGHLHIRPVTYTGTVAFGDPVIDVTGDLYVQGDITAGAKVNATGDVIVTGRIENALISAGGDVVAAGGIIFGGEGFIHTGGSLYARFLENVKAVIGGSVYADYSINSDISAAVSAYFCGGRGMLSGGSIMAGGSIKALKIGNPGRSHTDVRAGVVDVTEKDELEIKKKKGSCKYQLDMLAIHKRKLEKEYPPEKRNLMPLFLKIENAIFTKNEEMRALDAELTNVQNRRREAMSAKVIAKTEIYDGVDIKIGREVWHANCSKGVVVSLVSYRINVRAI